MICFVLAVFWPLFDPYLRNLSFSLLPGTDLTYIRLLFTTSGEGSSKTRFLGTALDLPDPAEMEHELQLPTYGHRAGGQNDGSLKQLPQIKTGRSPIGPPRKILAFFGFFRPTQKIAWDGPKWGREGFFPANPDLVDILAT